MLQLLKRREDDRVRNSVSATIITSSSCIIATGCMRSEGQRIQVRTTRLPSFLTPVEPGSILSAVDDDVVLAW